MTVLVILKMKKYLPILIFFLGLKISPATAQSDLSPRLLYIGLGASYPKGFVATGGSYNKNGWGGTLSINPMWSSASNVPADYHDGGFTLINNLNDFTLLAAIRVLKEWSTKSKPLKFGIEAGPVLVHTSIPDNFQYVSGWHLFSSNYTFDKVKENSVGFSLRGKFELSFSDWGGLELGCNANSSKGKSYFGVDLILTFGAYQE